MLIGRGSGPRHVSAPPGSVSNHRETGGGCSVRSAQKPFTGTATPPGGILPETSACRRFHGSQDFSITSFGRKHEFVHMTETRSGKQGAGWIRWCWHTSGVRSIGGPRPVVSLVPRSTTGYMPSSLRDERPEVPTAGLFSSFCQKWCFWVAPDAAETAGLPGKGPLRARKLFSSFCRELCLAGCRLGSDSRLTWKRDQQTGRWFDVIFEARFPPSFCHRQAPHLFVQFPSVSALSI